MKAYYAHCMALYDTAQERRDLLTLLGDLGWDVLNPNTKEHQVGCEKARLDDPANPSASINYFKPLVESCDILVFRALPDGAISYGVAQEIQWACDAGLPIIELPSGLLRRRLTIDQTREYIREAGCGDSRPQVQRARREPVPRRLAAVGERKPLRGCRPRALPRTHADDGTLNYYAVKKPR